MIVLVGASASGKTELAKILCNKYSYKKCITTTTRTMRSHEKQDIDYHFISKNTFLDLQSNGEFIEVTQYQDNFYGIQKKDVDLNGIVIVDPLGANALIDKIDQGIFVVYIETSENLRRTRMINRKDHQHFIDNRIISDAHVFQNHMLKRIELSITNEDISLEDIASLIHNQYQAYLNNIS